MNSYLFILSALLSLAPLSVFAQQQKPALITNHAPYEQLFVQSITPATVTRKDIWHDLIPQDCVEEMSINDDTPDGKARCALSKINVFQAWFSDAPDSWVFCKCSDAGYSDETLLEHFGRIPAAIRSPLRYTIAFKSNDGAASGWASRGNIGIYGIETSLLFHEIGHIFDHAHGQLSTKPEYINAHNQDICWITDYARSNGENNNWSEPWAVQFTYRQFQTQVGPLLVDASCNQNAMNAVAAQTDAIVAAGYDRAMKPGKGTILWRPEVPDFE